MKKFKRLLALVLALAMALSMAVTTSFAADSATLSFADKDANRTSLSNTQQVWEQNGITFVNDKGSSTTNVADYGNPVRLYKGSNITVKYPGMTSIVFTCNNASYANALSQTVPVANANVTVTDKVVTVELINSVDEFIIEGLSAQVRMNSLEVFTSGTPDAPEVPQVIESTIPEVLALGAGLTEETFDKYQVTGVITEVYNTTYGNMYITDGENTLTIYGSYSADGTVRYDALETKPVAGDTVTIVGVVSSYKGVAQIKNGCIVNHVPGEGEPEEPETPDPEADTELAIADAIALGESKDHNTYTEGKYYVSGVILEVYNTTYGNMKLIDAEGNILTVYGTYDADGTNRYDAMENAPIEGSTITVYGVIGQYNGTAQVKNGWITEQTAPVEHIVSSTALVAGDNNVALELTAVTTIYAFEPTETGTFTITVDNGTVGYWGGSEWFLTPPASATNTTEFECSGVGQTAYIGVTAPGSTNCTVTITKTAEYQPIVWDVYENTHTPDEANITYCSFDAESVVSEADLVKGDDGFYYVDGKLVVVDFNYSSMAISGMFGVKVTKGEGDATEYIDYTEALHQYTAVGGNYPLTEDLKVMLVDVAAHNDWAGFNGTVWTDLCFIAVDHVAGDAVEEEGYNNVYCATCGDLLSSEAITDEPDEPAVPVDVYANGANVDVAAGATVDCNLWFNGVLNMTVAGEGDFDVIYNGQPYTAVNGSVTIDGIPSNFYVPATMQIVNKGDANATYAVSFAQPVGTMDNPDELELGYNTNTLAEGNQGYWYTWTAEEAGTFSLQLYSENWVYVINNMTTYAYGDTQWSDSDPVVNPGTIEVAAGDVLNIMVGTYDPANMWTAPAGEIAFDASFTGLPGSESNPIMINDWTWNAAWSAADATVTVPAGSTVYYSAYASGMELTINGDAYGILTSSNPRMPAIFSITNDGAEDAEYALNIAYPAGNMSNPAELVLGENVANIAAGSQGYYYTWIAEEDGTLSISIEEENWTYVINNMTTYAYGDTQWSDSDPVVNPGTIEVAAGDEIQIIVNTYNPEDMWGNPADEAFTITASFETEPEHDLVHVEAVEPGCHYTGNVEHWYCLDCDTVWTDEALTQVSNHLNVIIPATGSNLLVHMDAVEAGCHYDGNVEYWICYECEQVWTDEALTQVSNIKNVVIPATGSNLLVHMDAVEPGCHYNGNVEHWICYECNQVWTDEALTQLSNVMNVVIPATGSENVTHFEAVEPACHYNGNVEYWTCADCGGYWTDEACTQVTNALSVVLPATGSNLLVHMDAVEPACHYDGNVEYWICYECNQVWTDEALTQLSNIKNVVIPATGSENLQHVAAKAPTCLELGNIEYWTCGDCGQYWQDEALTQLTNAMSVKLGTTEHDIAHVEAIEPGCHYNGNIEYWYCTICGSAWQDEALTQVTNLKNVVLPATGSDLLVHMDAVEPGCHYDGNIEYWICYECEQVWQDEALTQVTNIKNVVLPATGSENVTHFEAVEPACHYNGNVEYWTCADCGGYWTDEACTQVTNALSVVLPATGEGLLVHMEAVEPACHYDGNVEHWICYTCEQVWTDEALTQLTNIKNVVLPATGSENLKHVAAKAPTCETDGNIEYWVCEDCEQVWADEALTQLTNIKNVVIAATGHTYGEDGKCSVCGDSPKTGDSAPVAMMATLAVLAAGAFIVLTKKRRA